MHNRTNPDIDIIAYILSTVLEAKPEDEFCKSLQQQYAERGGLSKKQLEGLQGKAVRITGIHPGKLATLEAIIKKKHVTHRSTVSAEKVPEEKDLISGDMITAILEKYQAHKRVMLFRAIYEKDGKLPSAEKAELVKFYNLLIGKDKISPETH